MEIYELDHEKTWTYKNDDSAIGSNTIFRIEKDNPNFTPGIYLNFLDSNRGVNTYPIPKSRLLIYNNDNYKLPVYPVMNITTAMIVFDYILSKGIYLFPNELLYCMDESLNSVDMDKAAIVNYVDMYKGKHRDFNVWVNKLMHINNIDREGYMKELDKIEENI